MQPLFLPVSWQHLQTLPALGLKPGLSSPHFTSVPPLLPKPLKPSLPEDALPGPPHLTLAWQSHGRMRLGLVLGSPRSFH